MSVTIAIMAIVFVLCMWPVATLTLSLFAVLLGSAALLLWQAWTALSGLAFFGLLAVGIWVIVGLPLALGNLSQSR